MPHMSCGRRLQTGVFLTKNAASLYSQTQITYVLRAPDTHREELAA